MALRSSSCSVRNLCRSSIAENSSSASGLTRPSMRQRPLGGAQPLLLLLADVRHRLGRLLALGHLAGERHELVGAVVGDQRVGVEAELLERPLLELLDPHPLLGAGHLVAVDGVDQLVVLAAEVAQPARGRRAAPARGRRGPARRPAAARWRRWIETSSRCSTYGDGDADRLGGPALADQPLAALGGAGPGLALGLRRPGPAGRPGRAGRARAPRRCAARAGPPSRPAGPAGPPRRAARARRCRAPRRVPPRPRRAGVSSSARPARSWSRAASACSIAAASRSASPRAARACEPYWPSSSATAARVASDSCSLASATSTRCCASSRSLSSRDMSKPSRSRGRDRLGQLGVGLVDRGLDLDQALLARGAAGGEVGAEHVAVAGHRGDVGQLGDQAAGGARSSTTAVLNSSRLSAGRSVVGALHHVDGVRRAGRAGRASRRRSAGPPPSSSPARPRSSSLRWPIAPTAASASVTATASAAEPSAPATAAS